MKNPIYKDNTATLVEVAAKAGISRQTASRILGSGAHKHKPATVEKVRAVAKALGYRPNLLAKSVVAGRTFSIGVLMPAVVSGDSFFSKVISGIQQALLNTEWIPIILHTSPENPEREQIHRLVDRRVDGILLMPVTTEVAPDYFKEISDRKIPVVCINERLRNVGSVDFVGTDEAKGGKAAAKHLVQHGHRNLACIHWQEESVNLGQRYDGFAKVVKDAGARCQRIDLPGWTLENNLEVLRASLRSPNRPTAFFCISDHYAGMLYKAAELEGLKIPEDFSVIGYANMPWGQYLSPSLTTLRQEGQRIGAEATKRLLERIEGSKVRARIKRVAPTIIERTSVGTVSI